MADNVKGVEIDHVREKLIALIDEALQRKEGTARVVGKCYTRKIADHLIANSVTIQKWIPVTERLPDKFGEYIVAIKTISGVVYSDYADYDLFQQRWTTGLFCDIGSKVTHWMPLPEQPKGE